MTRSSVMAGAVPSIIAGKLRAMISCGTFAPGMRLGQTELAAQFTASRVPVREALKLLSAEGLVEHDPNRGFFVTRFSSDEARQLFRLRDLVEDELLSVIEWPDDALLAEIRTRAVELEDLLNSGSRAQWWALHREFHELIFNLSPNKIFVREAMRLWSLTDRYRAIAPLPRRQSEERSIVNKAGMVEALAKRDKKRFLDVRAERRKAFETLILEILGDREL
jgi:DNA-binding GntR family transcriptional regulator